MRRHILTLAVVAVAATPTYATGISPALAAYYASLGISQTSTAQVVSQPAPVSPVVNTTSPYSGFTSSGTPTTSYMGTVAPVVSPTTSGISPALAAYYKSLGLATTIVNNTTTTTPQQYTPQVITTVPTSSAGSVSTLGMSPALLAYYQSLGLFKSSTPTSTPTGGVLQGPSINTVSNPEPGTMLMMVGGLAAVVLLRKKLYRSA